MYFPKAKRRSQHLLCTRHIFFVWDQCSLGSGKSRSEWTMDLAEILFAVQFALRFTTLGLIRRV